MLLSLHVNQDSLLFGFSIWVLGVFRGNFLIFTIAKNAKLITKYAHVNLRPGSDAVLFMSRT